MSRTRDTLRRLVTEQLQLVVTERKDIVRHIDGLLRRARTAAESVRGIERYGFLKEDEFLIDCLEFARKRDVERREFFKIRLEASWEIKTCLLQLKALSETIRATDAESDPDNEAPYVATFDSEPDDISSPRSKLDAELFCNSHTPTSSHSESANEASTPSTPMDCEAFSNSQFNNSPTSSHSKASNEESPQSKSVDSEVFCFSQFHANSVSSHSKSASEDVAQSNPDVPLSSQSKSDNVASARCSELGGITTCDDPASGYSKAHDESSYRSDFSSSSKLNVAEAPFNEHSDKTIPTTFPPACGGNLEQHMGKESESIDSTFSPSSGNNSEQVPATDFASALPGHNSQQQTALECEATSPLLLSPDNKSKPQITIESEAAASCALLSSRQEWQIVQESEHAGFTFSPASVSNSEKQETTEFQAANNGTSQCSTAEQFCCSNLGDSSQSMTNLGDSSQPMPNLNDSSQPVSNLGDFSQPLSNRGDFSQPISNLGDSSQPISNLSDFSQPISSDNAQELELYVVQQQTEIEYEASEAYTDEDSSSEPFHGFELDNSPSSNSNARKQELVHALQSSDVLGSSLGTYTAVDLRVEQQPTDSCPTVNVNDVQLLSSSSFKHCTMQSCSVELENCEELLEDRVLRDYLLNETGVIFLDEEDSESEQKSEGGQHQIATGIDETQIHEIHMDSEQNNNDPLVSVKAEVDKESKQNDNEVGCEKSYNTCAKEHSPEIDNLSTELSSISMGQWSVTPELKQTLRAFRVARNRVGNPSKSKSLRGRSEKCPLKRLAIRSRRLRRKYSSVQGSGQSVMQGDASARNARAKKRQRASVKSSQTGQEYATLRQRKTSSRLLHIRKSIIKQRAVSLRSVHAGDGEESIARSHQKTSSKRHICEICRKEFRSVRFSSLHMNVHSRTNEHKCEVCAKTYLLPSSLRAHAQLHSGNVHVCRVCQAPFQSKAQLKYHANSRHGSPAAFECRLSQQYHTAAQSYFDSTNNVCFSCSICQRILTRNESLSEHLKMHAESTTTQTLKSHTDEKQQRENSVCQRTINRKGTPREHLKTIDESPTTPTLQSHTGEKRSNTSFSCHICQRPFTGKKSWREHLKMHVESATTPTLQRHTDEMQHESFVGHRTLKRKETLRMHMSLQDESPTTPTSKCHTDETHDDVICKRAHSRKETLRKYPKLHGECTTTPTLQSHTDEKRDNVICKRAFSGKETVRKHLIMHDESPITSTLFPASDTAEKPSNTSLSCNICQRVFGRKDSFKVHMKTHDESTTLQTSRSYADEKPGSRTFSCNICQRVYGRRDRFIVHMKAHGEGRNPMIACGLCPELFFASRSDLQFHRSFSHGQE